MLWQVMSKVQTLLPFGNDFLLSPKFTWLGLRDSQDQGWDCDSSPDNKSILLSWFWELSTGCMQMGLNLLQEVRWATSRSVDSSTRVPFTLGNPLWEQRNMVEKQDWNWVSGHSYTFWNWDAFLLKALWCMFLLPTNMWVLTVAACQDTI